MNVNGERESPEGDAGKKGLYVSGQRGCPKGVRLVGGGGRLAGGVSHATDSRQKRNATLK